MQPEMDWFVGETTQMKMVIFCFWWGPLAMNVLAVQKGLCVISVELSTSIFWHTPYLYHTCCYYCHKDMHALMLFCTSITTIYVCAHTRVCMSISLYKYKYHYLYIHTHVTLSCVLTSSSVRCGLVAGVELAHVPAGAGGGGHAALRPALHHRQAPRPLQPVPFSLHCPPPPAQTPAHSHPTHPPPGPHPT